MKFSRYLIYILPAALVTGPLIPEMIFFFVSLNFLILTIKKKFYSYYTNKFSILFFVFYFIFVATSLFSDEILISLKSSVPYIRFYFFTLGFIYIFINDFFFLKKFTKFLLYTLLAVSLSGYLEFFFKFNPFINTFEITRISGFFGNELIIGSYLSRLLPLYLLSTLTIEEKKSNPIFLFNIFFVYICIILSGERASLFYGMLSMLTYILLLGKNFYFKFFLATLLILCSFLFILTNERLNYRIIQETKNQMLNSYAPKLFSAAHQSHYITSYNMFLSKPLTGYGPKSFRYICKKKEFYKDLHSCSSHPHNFYMQLLAETGIIPAILLISIFFISLKKYINNIFKNKNLNLFIYLPILIFTFPLIPNGNFFNNWLSMISFFSLTLSIYFVFFKKIHKEKIIY